MKSADELRRENEALRDRLSRLGAAGRRAGASLDVDTIVHEIAESARALTGARYGAVATLDDSGQPRDFVTSGFTPDERRQLAEWPDGPRLFGHFRDFPRPTRLRDLPGYVRSLGCCSDPIPSKTLQAAPMRHRGVQVGAFFLAGKAGGQAFTREDEEILVLLASQAATAIANPRTRRGGQRARADLEALAEILPVGVAVFDAGTGNPVSLNREAKRIVEGLRTPGHPPEQLLEVMTCRFADGREISLDALPLSRHSSSAAAVRAEEIVLSVPDGRSVTTLVNATPTRSEDGAVASVVVTLQDLAPIEELERLRAELPGMALQKLRVPLTSIKGSTATVLGAAPVLDPAEMLQFFRIIDERADHMRGLIGGLP